MTDCNNPDLYKVVCITAWELRSEAAFEGALASVVTFNNRC